MALGDGLAGLIGPQIPSIRWQVLGQTKSLAGTGAMAAASLLALGGLTALASGLGLAAPSWPSLLLLTGVATGLEQLSRYGGDNLTVPLATGMLWQQLSG
jgi:phytol kinase